MTGTFTPQECVDIALRTFDRAISSGASRIQALDRTAITHRLSRAKLAAFVNDRDSAAGYFDFQRDLDEVGA